MEFKNDLDACFIALPLPVASGSVDYRAYELLLRKVDQILVQSGAETALQAQAVEIDEQITKSSKKSSIDKVKRYASYALRCNIARCLSQESYRKFSVHLADSILLRNFCRLDTPYAPKETPSKSTLQRFESYYSEDLIRKITDLITFAGVDVTSELHNNLDGLLAAVDTEVWLLDTTCMKLDIHHPVDWVLLKDCLKSIVQSIIQIRKSGVRHRIGNPESFISAMNKLSMEMTQGSKRNTSKKEKKATFRKMEKLLKRVASHGEKYFDIIQEDWEEYGFSEAQANQILRKMRKTLDHVPAVIFVAHERVIGERPVDNSEKLLSVHEGHANVYTRGKSGAQVELGLQLLLGENLDGMIMHWELIDGKPKNDTQHLDGVIARRNSLPATVQPTFIVGDRGFHSKKNESSIEDEGMESCICPMNPNELKQRLEEEHFQKMTRRRAQTEARIGILKNNFLGRKLTTKGYENQSKQVAWAVLSHNVWLLARQPYIDLLEDKDSA
jgi:hypothetical protein